jgi:hypothetical protein
MGLGLGRLAQLRMGIVLRRVRRVMSMNSMRLRSRRRKMSLKIWRKVRMRRRWRGRRIHRNFCRSLMGGVMRGLMGIGRGVVGRAGY